MVEIPTRRISETILDFGEPLLALFDEPTVDDIRNALQIVIAAWNAHVMAMPAWGSPQHLQALRILLASSVAPSGVPLFEVLAARRAASFADDPRAVGEWAIEPDGEGGYQFRCDARVPPSLLEEK